MEDMTYDMANHLLYRFNENLSLRKTKINAVGVVGLVEKVSGNAQRPGDIDRLRKNYRNC